MAIIFKKMETDDEIKGKAYVHWKSWQEAYTGIVDQQYLDKLTLQKCEEIAYRWPDNIIVAKDGELVIGFVGYGKYRNDELADTGEIFAIYLLKDYYGQRIGYHLMQKALVQLTDYSTAAVWVLRDNKRAIQFYRRCGFDFDGCEKTLLLGSPITEVRMIMDRNRTSRK